MAKGNSSANSSKGSYTTVSSLGFNADGIASQSRGAQFMASTAVKSGGGVPSGSTVSTL